MYPDFHIYLLDASDAHIMLCVSSEPSGPGGGVEGCCVYRPITVYHNTTVGVGAVKLFTFILHFCIIRHIHVS